MKTRYRERRYVIGSVRLAIGNFDGNVRLFPSVSRTGRYSIFRCISTFKKLVVLCRLGSEVKALEVFLVEFIGFPSGKLYLYN